MSRKAPAYINKLASLVAEMTADQRRELMDHARAMTEKATKGVNFAQVSKPKIEIQKWKYYT